MDLLIMIWGFSAVHLTFSGAMGGVTRWLLLGVIMSRPMTASQILATVFLGGIVGFFVTPQAGPALSEAFEFLFRSPPDPEKAPIFNAYLLGILGIGIVGFAIDTFTSWTKRKLANDAAVPPSPKPADGGP